MPEIIDGFSSTNKTLTAESCGSHGEASNFAPLQEFEEILRLHRRRASIEEVLFLEHLCFSLPNTADSAGVRYVLWEPVALFLQHGFHIEIEERLCHGQVALAYLKRDAAAFADKILPRIEIDRRRYPQASVTSGPQIGIQRLPEIAEGLRWVDQPAFERLERMLQTFKNAVRRGDFSGLPALRAELAELAAVAEERDIVACVQFLRAGALQESSRPEGSASLASQSALARDWLTPEEDAAWSYLHEAM